MQDIRKYINLVESFKDENGWVWSGKRAYNLFKKPVADNRYGDNIPYANALGYQMPPRPDFYPGRAWDRELDSYIANALENAMLDYESGEGGYETVDDAFHDMSEAKWSNLKRTYLEAQTLFKTVDLCMLTKLIISWSTFEKNLWRLINRHINIIYTDNI